MTTLISNVASRHQRLPLTPPVISHGFVLGGRPARLGMNARTLLGSEGIRLTYPCYYCITPPREEYTCMHACIDAAPMFVFALRSQLITPFPVMTGLTVANRASSTLTPATATLSIETNTQPHHHQVHHPLWDRRGHHDRYGTGRGESIGFC